MEETKLNRESEAPDAAEMKDNDLIEMPAFVPVQVELIQLLKYWYWEFLSVDLWEYWSCTTGAWERYKKYVSRERGGKICDLLPNDKREKAMNEVREAFKKEHKSQFSEEDWKVFFKGTPEQREELENRCIKRYAEMEESLAQSREEEWNKKLIQR